jgi:hypothetical protein
MFPTSMIHAELARTRQDELVKRLALRQPRPERAAAQSWALLKHLFPSAVPSETVHFAHREAAGITVDLYWTRRELEDAFRVEVVDRCSQTKFTLHPATGKEAVAAYHHPFAAAASTGDSTGASEAERF